MRVTQLWQFYRIHELSEHYSGGYAVVHLWTIICYAMDILGENERKYLRDDLKEVPFMALR